MSLVSNPKDGDNVSVRQAIAKLGSSKLGPTSTPTYAGLTLTGLTINSLVYPVVADDGTSTGALTSLGAATDGQIPVGDTGGIPILATISGTANEIDVTNGAGTITIGLVNPLIVAKGGSGAAAFTDHSILLGSGTEPFTALGLAANGQIPIGFQNSDPVLANITGAANQITVTNGAGTIALSTPQDIHTGASPTFAGLNIETTEVIGIAISRDGYSKLRITNTDNSLIGEVSTGTGVGAGLWLQTYSDSPLHFSTNNGDAKITLGIDDNIDFYSGNLTTTGTFDGSAGEVLVEDKATTAPVGKSDGYIGVAKIGADGRVYFAVEGVMYYVDGTAATVPVTGNPIGLLLTLTYNIP